LVLKERELVLKERETGFDRRETGFERARLTAAPQAQPMKSGFSR
jgi:hypothetical protein